MEVIGETDRIFPIKAGETKIGTIQIDGFQKPFEAQIVKTVEAKELLNFLNGMGSRDQLFAGGEIDAIEAGIAVRRATHRHMDFLGSSLSECLDAVSGGRSTNNGVFNDDESLVAQ